MPALIAVTLATATPLGRALVALASRAGRGLKQFAERLRNRRDAMKLAQLDDRMLADIGLTRSDLRDAYAEPLWHDPSDVLAQRAAERRVSRQREFVDCEKIMWPTAPVIRPASPLIPAPPVWSQPPLDRPARYLM